MMLILRSQSFFCGFLYPACKSIAALRENRLARKGAKTQFMYDAYFCGSSIQLAIQLRLCGSA